MGLRLKQHPPLEYGSRTTSNASGQSTMLAHAFVSLQVELPKWSWETGGQVQLVRLLESQDNEWRLTNLATKSLRQLPSSAAPALSPRVQQDLESWLDRWQVVFFRQPEVNLISEFGESRKSFEHRVALRIKPLIQKKIKEIDARPIQQVFWWRKAAEAARAADKQRVTSEGAMFSQNIESLKVTHLLASVQLVELGALLLVPGTKLPT